MMFLFRKCHLRSDRFFAKVLIGFQIQILVGALFVLSSCQCEPTVIVKSARITPPTRPAFVAPSKLKKPSKQETITIREWKWRDGSHYRDRNGDSMVDWQAIDEQPYVSDAYSVFKEDSNYDGFYDRELRVGGYAGETTYEKKIYERVPPIHRIYPPTRVTRRPKR